MHIYRYHTVSEGVARHAYGIDDGHFVCMVDLTTALPQDALTAWRALDPPDELVPVVLELEATDRTTERGAVYYRIAMVARVVWSPCGEEPGQRTPAGDAYLDWHTPALLAPAGSTAR